MTLKVTRTGRPTKAVYMGCGEEIYRMMKFLEHSDREEFYILHLDNKNMFIAKELISIGTLSGALVHPREVFKGAVLNNSSRIICVHNHTSGDPTPSWEDKDITRRLREAGDIIGIPIVDHVVIGHGGYKQVDFTGRG